MSFSHQGHLVGFHMSQSDSQFLQVSRTLLINLADLNNVVA